MRQKFSSRIAGSGYRRVISLSAPFRAAVLMALMVFLLAGCGGGGGGGSSTPSTKKVVPQVSIQWGARSRSVGVTSSTLSVVVTLKGAADGGDDLQCVANRGTSSLTSYAQTYSFPASVVEKSYPMTVQCYGQTGGSAPLVAQGGTTATVGDSGALPDVSLSNVVAGVAITGGQSVLAGQTADLAVTAYDSANAVVPVTPGSIFLTVTGGTTSLAAASSGGATVQALHPGTATVTATIDSVTSLAATVAVISNAAVTISPASPPTLNVGDSQQFTAAVANAADPSVTWSVQEGATGGTITATGLYVAPAATGTYHVVAASNYDPTHQAVVAVTVANGSVTLGGTFPASGGVGATVN